MARTKLGLLLSGISVLMLATCLTASASKITEDEGNYLIGTGIHDMYVKREEARLADAVVWLMILLLLLCLCVRLSLLRARVGLVLRLRLISWGMPNLHRQLMGFICD